MAVNSVAVINVTVSVSNKRVRIYTFMRRLICDEVRACLRCYRTCESILQYRFWRFARGAICGYDDRTQ